MTKLFAGCLALAVVLILSCADPEPAQVCTLAEERHQSEILLCGFAGLDLLIVVDNSRSMAEEQRILATSVVNLLNAFVYPLPDWPVPAADDVRVAVVSSEHGAPSGV